MQRTTMISGALASLCAVSLFAGGAQAQPLSEYVADPSLAIAQLDGLLDEVTGQVGVAFDIEIPAVVNQTVEAVRDAIVQADAQAPFLATGIAQNWTETMYALQAELLPIAEGAMEDAGVPRECLEDTFTIVSGCATDIAQIANRERASLMARVRSNPMLLFQPTSLSVLSAGRDQLDQYLSSGVTWDVSPQCCSSLASLSAGGCLCNADTVDLLTAITGEGFLDAVRGAYSASCPGTLNLYPSASC